jgi:hypothetical protein
MKLIDAKKSISKNLVGLSLYVKIITHFINQRRTRSDVQLVEHKLTNHTKTISRIKQTKGLSENNIYILSINYPILGRGTLALDNLLLHRHTLHETHQVVRVLHLQGPHPLDFQPPLLWLAVRVSS